MKAWYGKLIVLKEGFGSAPPPTAGAKAGTPGDTKEPLGRAILPLTSVNLTSLNGSSKIVDKDEVMVLSGLLIPLNLVFISPVFGKVSAQEALDDLLCLLCSVLVKEEDEVEVAPTSRIQEGRTLDASDGRDIAITVDS